MGILDWVKNRGREPEGGTKTINKEAGGQQPLQTPGQSEAVGPGKEEKAIFLGPGERACLGRLTQHFYDGLVMSKHSPEFDKAFDAATQHLGFGDPHGDKVVSLQGKEAASIREMFEACKRTFSNPGYKRQIISDVESVGKALERDGPPAPYREPEQKTTVSPKREKGHDIEF